MHVADDHDDDRPIGRVLTRREVVALAGVGGLALVAAACGSSSSSGAAAPSTTPAGTAATLPSCIVRPELTEGPYFVDERLERSDIRSDPSDGSVSEGLPLSLAFLVSRIDGSSCVPFQGALVDVWHCDALGVYSDVSDPGFDTTGKKFLRGYQTTDASGRAAFTTIYPGWYEGRTVHIHFKIRTDPDADQGLELTSQLFFNDAVTDQVHAREPYSTKGQRTLRNDGDGIFGQGGEQLLLALTGDPASGYEATFEIGVQVS